MGLDPVTIWKLSARVYCIHPGSDGWWTLDSRVLHRTSRIFVNLKFSINIPLWGKVHEQKVKEKKRRVWIFPRSHCCMSLIMKKMSRYTGAPWWRGETQTKRNSLSMMACLRDSRVNLQCVELELEVYKVLPHVTCHQQDSRHVLIVTPFISHMHVNTDSTHPVLLRRLLSQ